MSLFFFVLKHEWFYSVSCTCSMCMLEYETKIGHPSIEKRNSLPNWLVLTTWSNWNLGSASITKTLFDHISNTERRRLKIRRAAEYFYFWCRLAGPVWKCVKMLFGEIDIKTKSKLKLGWKMLKKENRKNLWLLRSDIQTPSMLWIPFVQFNLNESLRSLRSTAPNHHRSDQNN